MIITLICEDDAARRSAHGMRASTSEEVNGPTIMGDISRSPLWKSVSRAVVLDVHLIVTSWWGSHRA